MSDERPDDVVQPEPQPEVSRDLGPVTQGGLPVTQAGWLAARTMNRQRTINEEVEQAHIELVGSDKGEEYLKLLNATNHQESITGHTRMDDIYAANMIIEQAAENGSILIKNAKPYAIVKTLNSVIARRYRGLSRKARRDFDLAAE
jgi:hypothetical protein